MREEDEKYLKSQDISNARKKKGRRASNLLSEVGKLERDKHGSKVISMGKNTSCCGGP